MFFTATVDDVKVIVLKRGDQLPVITSVMITDGALAGEAVKEEYCESGCGVQDESIPVIIDGVEAREGAWPWNAGR